MKLGVEKSGVEMSFNRQTRLHDELLEKRIHDLVASAIRSVQDILFAVSQQQHGGCPEQAQQLRCPCMQPSIYKALGGHPSHS